MSFVRHRWKKRGPARADWLLFGAMIPGAVAGALLVPQLPEAALALLVALA